MRTKDLVNLEEAYQKVLEDYTGTTDPNMLRPEEVTANQQETQSREAATFTLNNIVAAFKQQGNTTVTPLEGNKLPEELRNVFFGRGGTEAKNIVGSAPDLKGSKLFLIQKDLGILKKAIRTAQVGRSIKISKAVLEVKNDRALVYMINDVTNKVVFTRPIFDTESLYKVVDEFNKFAS